jgi:serine/threonine protein kinase
MSSSIPASTPGKPWQPPEPEDLAPELPQYEILGLLGRGGMGAVYRARQRSLNREVAIKVLPPTIEDADMHYAERFIAEAQSMARLEHPGIIAVYDAGQTPGGLLYFVMQYVQGTDVSQMIQSSGRLPPEHAYAITAHVCEALAYAHKNGLIHRDIKPANIMVDMEGRVKVADFGLAKAVDAQTGFTQSNMAVGTPDFVAPEALVAGMPVDGRADLYAVGVMLYQMLTGSIPRGAFKPASVIVPGLDARFDQIVFKAMQVDREERHSSATELRQHLDTLLMPAVAAPDLQRYSSAQMPKQAAPTPQSRPGVAAARPAAAAPKPDGRAKATPVLRSEAPPPAKSKTPLFIGIGAAAAIGIGAFVMFSGGNKAKQSSPLSPLSGTGVASASKSTPSTERTAPPSPIKPAASSKPEPKPTVAAKSPEPAKPAAPEPKKEQAQTPATSSPEPAKTMQTPIRWVDFTEAVIQGSSPDSVRKLPTGFEVIKTISSNVNRTQVSDSILRVRHRGGVGLQLRYQNNHALYAAFLRSGGVVLRVENAGGSAFASKTIQTILPPGFDTKSEHESTFIAQRDELSVWVDGKLVGSVKDSTLDSGYARLTGDPGTTILKVEYGILPSAIPPPARLPDPAKWVKVFESTASAPGGMKLNVNATVPVPSAIHSSLSVRARFSHGLQDSVAINLRSTANMEGGLSTMLIAKVPGNRGSVFVEKRNGNSGIIRLGDFVLPETLKEAPSYLLEFQAVDNVLSVSVDGVMLGSVLDDGPPQTGSASIYSTNGTARDVEWQSLETLHPADEKLAALEREFQDRVRKEATAPFAAAVAELAVKFKSALERGAASVPGSPAAAQIRADMSRLDKQEPIPPADEPKLATLLVTLRKAWHGELDKLRTARLQNAAPARKSYDEALAVLQKELEDKGDINRAEKVRLARAAVQKPEALPAMTGLAALPKQGPANVRPTRTGKLKVIGAVEAPGNLVDITPFAAHADYVQVMTTLNGVAALRADGSVKFLHSANGVFKMVDHAEPPVARLTHGYGARFYGLTAEGRPVVIGPAVANMRFEEGGFIQFSGVENYWAGLQPDGGVHLIIADAQVRQWLPNPAELPPIKAIHAHQDNFFILTRQGEVRCWKEVHGEYRLPLDLRRNITRWSDPFLIFDSTSKEMEITGHFLDDRGRLFRFVDNKLVERGTDIENFAGPGRNAGAFHWQPKRKGWVVPEESGFYGEITKLSEVLSKGTPISWDIVSGAVPAGKTGIFAWIE